MIKKIDLLKCFGIFQNFRSTATLNKFEKFNLLYGWNGSGKSTLSKLFAFIQKKELDEDFKDCEFKVETDEGVVTNQNLSECNLNVRVFNQDFIKANIEWDKKVNSILVIAEEKIDERKKLEELQKDAFKITNKGTQLVQEKEHLSKQINTFYSSAAKTIKESFKVIDTKDTYYFNYDKTRFERFIADNESKVYDANSVLSESDRSELVKSIQPVEKSVINLVLPLINIEDYSRTQKEISEIVARDVVAKTIDKLKEQPELNSWVKKGLELHDKENVETCEFCLQPLPKHRIQDLREHFNEAYTEIINQITAYFENLEQLELNAVEYPDSSNFYSEFQENYLKHKLIIERKRLEINALLLKWKETLQNKQTNPFSFFELKDEKLNEAIIEYNSKVDDLMLLVNQHNKKCQNFTTELATHKTKLELHYSAELIQKSELKNWKQEKNDNEATLIELRKELTETNKKIRDLEAILIDEAKGADQFNKYLHKFLGRTDISLQFNPKEKGYNILRGKDGRIARNLSEGEKTAIAFVYFVIKLKEKGNDIEQTVIVVDDPISSFDSNHLFHSYAFLKNSCEKAKQLFILTHNFQYFRLVRDWIDKKNTVRRNVDGTREEVVKARYFSIECSSDEDRSSAIKNAHDTLQKYNSEYHYVFNKMYSYQNDQIDSLDKAYMIGNLCRKLLEGFLTFKFPKARSDFRALMNDSCEDKEALERIYRFINKYSHNQLVEFYDTPVDNLVSEGNSIVNDVFDLMRALDPKHFSEMEEICAN